MTGIWTTARPISLAILGGALVAWTATATCADQAARLNAQVRAGEQIARERCAACHVVAEKQEFGPLLREPAPSFKSIANRPATTEESLRHFVTTTHWDLKTLPLTMPDPELTKTETTAVVRYILSLKDH
jgi:mono/diheme cytochrome c family protein